MDCDRISELPDCLLTQILLYLPTKVSVSTSVLSKRWRFLWLMVPGLDLENPPTKCFESFIDNFMESNHKSRMQKFSIKSPGDHNRFVDWIEQAVVSGIHQLSVDTIYHCINMPHNIYQSKTLVSLKLARVRLEDPEVVVSLPCLKNMYLENVEYHSNLLIIEKLISGCPVLEDVTLIIKYRHVPGKEEVSQLLRVRSEFLKSFSFAYNGRPDRKDYAVEIDAAQLKYMKFMDTGCGRIVVKNLSSLFKVDLDTAFDKYVYGRRIWIPKKLSMRDVIPNFLTGISSVRHMIISYRTVRILHCYSILGPFPKFDNLYRLEAKICSYMFEFLTFLERCPNLKTLILDFGYNVTKKKQIEVRYVPRCLLVSLEYVEFKGLIWEEEIGKKQARYFLENSVVLKKLRLWCFRDSLTSKQDSDISKELLTFTKRSPECQIIMHCHCRTWRSA
ncbi:hypothetical protein CARUB_v10028667mg [Capsella rubella]|uniref:FBD domain-containing protein n=1 Tax=Capsella rubella TaxID=81985 RepID=R0GVQ7_9BRAS|nr:F-box/FBD/LRR-repeat protein At2g26030 [Capsella rubella]EOA15268.1 hypothetical protein CARUB_v10028667mg [Capsella rubella]